jgi:hypothetical protein
MPHGCIELLTCNDALHLRSHRVGRVLFRADHQYPFGGNLQIIVLI